ncbi:G-type lectin S-receptor-like serine/threonine-protein kinase SD1-1 [Camellia sinensis]|uniref:G-type lectin S-receptor-like serine/threonine-protein kinase SD1-1 n=1 Tax=Camellia sinensis TaxID=4442 RepID=UPI001036A437|nr:G-type lectin S-receptor-like serine/threonine-protein kinase SD1-1 [Camellia sinensis]
MSCYRLQHCIHLDVSASTFWIIFYGPILTGILEGGQEIAVKRLSKNSSQGLDEFKNEEHGLNLAKNWSDQTRRMLLDWPKRFHIINGISRGLLYLHQDSRLRIIHRDLKASNILLDIDMNPKILDFGLPKSFGGNETEANTKRVVRTYGYMSPEYAIDGLFSVKSDVFSFGVLMLEIVSGKKNRGFYHPGHSLNLLGHWIIQAWRLYEEGKSLELLDETLWDLCYQTEMLRSIHVGLLCVQESPEDRPSMSSVVLMLSSEATLPRAKQPGFFTARNVLQPGSSSSKEATTSANEITITLLSAR